MKRLNLVDGAVLAHPFEIAERVQQYAQENVEEVLSLFFERYGVLGPNGDELAVSIEADEKYHTTRASSPALQADSPFTLEAHEITNSFEVNSQTQLVAVQDRHAELRLRVNAGYAVVGSGAIRLPSSRTIAIPKREHLTAGSVTKTLFVNLLYAEASDTPTDLIPYGSGTADLRTYSTYRLVVAEEEPTQSTGVALAKVTLRVLGSTVEDLRATNAARLRADGYLTAELLDPALVPEIQRLMEQPDVVDDIIDLLDNKRLNGGIVVTEPAQASPPLFVRIDREPEFRYKLRRYASVQGNDIQFISVPSPDPDWRVLVEWNLYGVRVEKLTATTFRVHTPFDLSSVAVAPGEDPYFLRFDGVDLEIASFDSSDTLTTADPTNSAATEDGNGAVHNGASEFYVQASPSTVAMRRHTDSSFAIDAFSHSLTGILLLPDGSWSIVVKSESPDRRNTYSLVHSFTSLAQPSALDSVEVAMEQHEPAYEMQGAGAVEANPFDKLEIGAQGEPVVDTSGVDRFVQTVHDELRRVQEIEVGMDVRVNFAPRSQVDGLFGYQMTAGVRLSVDLYTMKGWHTIESRDVMRPVSDLVKEMAWIDAGGDAFRGTVSSQASLQNLSENLSRISATADRGGVREGDIVEVNGDANAALDGHYRYEPRVKEIGAGITSTTYLSGADATKGYWVQVDFSKSSFTPAPLTVNFSRLIGGADYRITARPLGEMGDLGPAVVTKSSDLRQAFNARIGYDLHKTVSDMHRTFSLLMEQVDPSRLEGLVDEQIARLQAAIEHASLYGNPPKIDGPFTIPMTPGPTAFSGTSLGAVSQVLMRYVPTGGTSTQSVVVAADFEVQYGGNSEPIVVINNLPDYDQLASDVPPLITLIFDAGVRGQGYATIRYQTTTPQVFSPTVASFLGLQRRKISVQAKKGNTASFWGYIENHTDGPTFFGPYAKQWPNTGGGETEATLHSYLTGTITEDGFTAVPRLANAKSITFKTESFVSANMLDVRIRRAPTESLVKQLAFTQGASYSEFRAALLPAAKEPYYYQIDVQPDTVTVWIEEHHLPSWQSKNFVLEYVYYDGAINGSYDDCKGLFLNYLGTNSKWTAPGETPSNTMGEDGDYFYYPDGAAWVKRAGVWAQATPVKFDRHSFSVLSVQTDAPILVRDVLIEVSATAGTGGPALGVSVQVRELPTVSYNSDTTPFQSWAKDGSTVELVAPTNYNTGGIYAFSHWEAGDSTTKGWAVVGKEETLQIKLAAGRRFIRAVYDTVG